MSKSEIAKYTCPNCFKVSDVKAWKSVNVDIDPELKQKVLNGSIFNFQCPSCHVYKKFFYTFLYHDMTRKFMIYLKPASEKRFADISLDDLQKQTITPVRHFYSGYRLRAVPTHNRLKEKILIFDEGLDDRTIELIKGLTWINYLSRQGVRKLDVFFSGADTQKEIPIIYFDYFDKMGAYRTIQQFGSGYPQTLEFLHKEFKAPIKEKPIWKVVDHSYMNRVVNGNG